MARLIRSLPLTSAWGAILLVSSVALGQPAPASQVPPLTERITMRLDYHGVPGCSNAEPFTLALTPRVHGWDPLAPESPWRLVVTVERSGRGFKGSTELYDPKGGAPWVRRVPVKFKCFDVLDTLALIVAFHVDPPDAPPPPTAKPLPPPAPVEKPPPVPPEPIVVPVELPTAPERARFVPRVGAGASVDFGGAWGALFGVTLEGGVQRREWERGGWSLMGTLRWAPQQIGLGPPTALVAPDVSSSLIAGSLAGCVYRAWSVSLAGCALIELGEVQLSAGTPFLNGFHQTALFTGGGMRARVERPLSDLLYVQMTTDLLGVGTLAGSTNKAANANARSLGSAAGGLGAGLGASF